MKVSKSRIAIAVLLLLAINTPLHAATPKAGAKCTKAGATSTSGGKKFTCIKSGTKLVWNKGVEIKAAAPKPTPSPAATATPTPTPTPTPTVKVEEPVGRWQDTQFGIVKALSALTPATVQKLNFVYINLFFFFRYISLDNFNNVYRALIH